MDGAISGIDDYVSQIKERYDALKSSTERTNFESHWEEIAELVQPRKLGFVGMRTAGEKRMNRVYDPTGVHSNELLAAGLHGMATNPAAQWFSLRMVGKRLITMDGREVDDINQVEEVQKYLSDVEQIMWARIYQPGTNFTTALHETYLDLGAFGTAILFIGQRSDGGLLFEARSLAECVICENADGKVDTVYRKTDYTVRQLMQMAKQAGWKPSSQTLDKARNNKLDDTVCVIHAVYPREDRDPTKKGPRDMPYASCYFEHETGHRLDESGFPEFPYMVVRWSKYAGEIYGRAPGMTALPDLKMLQAMTLTLVKAAQKIVDPPMWLRDDGVVGQTRTIPGGINYWRGNPNDGVMMMPVSGQGLPVTMDLLEQIRNRIRTTFFVDVLQFTSDAQMTATEVMQRTAERMRLMGPLIGRLESEMLGPLVERVFGILTRLQLLPEVPELISEQEFTVEYVSPIATAQKQQSANGVIQAMQLVAGTLGPEGAMQVGMQRLDAMKLVEYAWDLFNCDPDLLLGEEEMAQREQMAQAQQALQMGAPAADMAQKGAGAIESLSRANAAQNPDGSGGMDMSGFIQQLQQQLQSNPQAQNEIRRMIADGEQPDPAAFAPAT